MRVASIISAYACQQAHACEVRTALLVLHVDMHRHVCVHSAAASILWTAIKGVWCAHDDAYVAGAAVCHCTKLSSPVQCLETLACQHSLGPTPACLTDWVS